MPLIYATFENEWSDWMNEWQEAYLYLPSLSSFWHPLLFLLVSSLVNVKWAVKDPNSQLADDMGPQKCQVTGHITC